jgi:hypothetical protein
MTFQDLTLDLWPQMTEYERLAYISALFDAAGYHDVLYNDTRPDDGWYGWLEVRFTYAD